MLLLDSINGKKNLKLPEIKQKINSFKLTLTKQEGISNVIVVENYTDYIIKFECNFENLDKLKKAFETSLQESNTTKKTENWVNFDKKLFYRTTPEYAVSFLKDFYCC